MTEPDSQYAKNEFIAHVERVADGTRWLEAPGGVLQRRRRWA